MDPRVVHIVSIARLAKSLVVFPVENKPKKDSGRLNFSKIKAVREKMDNRCYCDGPINDCQNDWEGPGPAPPCPNAPKSEKDYEPEDGWKND
jgi:hypothetical protein